MCGVANPFRKSPSAFGLPSASRSWKSTLRSTFQTVSRSLCSMPPDTENRFRQNAGSVNHSTKQGRSGTPKVIANEVGSLPILDPVWVSIQAVPVNRNERKLAFFDNRSRRGITIEFVAELRGFNAKENLIALDRPLSLSTHSTLNSVPSTLAVVSQSCDPQITGEDQALPWIAVDQTMALGSSSLRSN